MNAIAKRENAYEELYSLLSDFDLKILELSAFVKQQEKGEVDLISANEMNRLKLHRKLLKTASSEQWETYKSEIQKPPPFCRVTSLWSSKKSIPISR